MERGIQSLLDEADATATRIRGERAEEKDKKIHAREEALHFKERCGQLENKCDVLERENRRHKHTIADMENTSRT